MIDSMIMAPVSGSTDTVGAPPPVVADSSAPRDTATRTDLDALRAQSPIVPVSGVQAKDLVNSFGDGRSGARTHNALDIMAPRKTPILSAFSGKVLKLHTSTAGGLTVYTLDSTGRFVILYGHLDSYRPGLTEGAPVAKGEILGFVGSTGNASPGAPHLHFQVMRSEDPGDWWRGVPINPYLIFHRN